MTIAVDWDVKNQTKKVHEDCINVSNNCRLMKSIIFPDQALEQVDQGLQCLINQVCLKTWNNKIPIDDGSFHNIQLVFWPRDYKTFFILNSAEHEIYPAHKC